MPTAQGPSAGKDATDCHRRLSGELVACGLRGLWNAGGLFVCAAVSRVLAADVTKLSHIENSSCDQCVFASFLIARLVTITRSPSLGIITDAEELRGCDCDAARRCS